MLICMYMVMFVGHAEKYHMPYGGLVPSDPTFEEMRRLIVTERRRPHLPSEWQGHKVRHTLLSQSVTAAASNLTYPSQILTTKILNNMIPGCLSRKY